MPNLFLEKSITIAAKSSVVWNSLVKPYVSDWEVGSSVRGNDMEGKILKIEPQKLLKHNVLHTGRDGVSTLSSVVTFELRERDGSTTLIVRESFAEAQDDAHFAKALAGWEATLGSIKTSTEA